MIDPKDYSTRFEFDRTRFDLIHRGDWRPPFVPPPLRVKILLVTDGYPGKFLVCTCGRLHFSLSEVVNALQNNPEPWVRFDLVKAHRQTDPLGEADIESFRFTAPGVDLDEFDLVWFFGARDNENDTKATRCARPMPSWPAWRAGWMSAGAASSPPATLPTWAPACARASRACAPCGAGRLRRCV